MRSFPSHFLNSFLQLLIRVTGQTINAFLTIGGFPYTGFCSGELSAIFIQGIYKTYSSKSKGEH